MYEMKKVKLKPPKTFEEQIEILKSRNLIVRDEKRANKILSAVNYYRLTGYGLHIKKGDKYNDGATIETLFEIYNFDKKLRNILKDVLESVEVSMRTYIAYTLAHKYGPVGYLDETNYKKGRNSKEVYKKFIREFESRKMKSTKELFVEHHIKKYSGVLPIWVATEIMSFGMLSRLYYNLKTEDRSHIANVFIGVNHTAVSSWMVAFSNLRNTCAHYGRIYNRRYNILPKIHEELSSYKVENDTLFAIVLAIKYMLPYEYQLGKLIHDLECAFIEYKDYISIDLIGFPENWIEILNK